MAVCIWPVVDLYVSVLALQEKGQASLVNWSVNKVIIVCFCAVISEIIQSCCVFLT